MKKIQLFLMALVVGLSTWAQDTPALGDLYYSDVLLALRLSMERLLSELLPILVAILSVRTA
ncbi:MAG: hypothetical protein IJ724_07750 [Muribaculaceae bacterium]|nr:hypothetical protein [Muribaculaceae bacterium]MBR1726523.1 hypothetical protein [Muribaculaceae bacterium]